MKTVLLLKSNKYSFDIRGYVQYTIDLIKIYGILWL
jgi:hypothetical protein